MVKNLFKNKNTIRFKIVLYSMGTAFALSLIVSVLGYFISVRQLHNNQRKTSENIIRIIGTDIANDLDDTTMFVNWVQSDTTINSYVRQNTPDYIWSSESARRRQALDAYDRLSDEYTSISYQDFISRIIVSTQTPGQYLNIQPRPYHGSLNPISDIERAPFYQELLSADDFVWTGIVDNPLSSYDNQQIIPVLRPITRFGSSSPIGMIYVELTPDIITKHFRSANLTGGSELYITIGDDHTYRYTSGDLEESQLPEEHVSYKLKNSGWIVSISMPHGPFLSGMKDYIAALGIVVVLIMIMGIIMSVRIGHLVNRPVSALLTRLDRTGRGDFSIDPSIEWNNEFGMIGGGINQLSTNIGALMDTKLRSEKEQQDLKYKLLLSQVNPHFLYNSLNTIKWMATIQGADGIGEMATALSRLMKNIAKGTDSLVPLRDEIALLNDYFCIMKYRYGGTIDLSYDIPDESVLGNKVIRFSLQPIVENAIFHGLEPKGSGSITIRCYTDNNNLIIEVTDNGVGMDKDQIDKVLSGTIDSANDFFRHVGVANINQRIAYKFGSQYGISIESIVGEYTTMKYTLPTNINT